MIQSRPMLKLDANWNYEQSDSRHHYLLKAKLGRHVIGRAHGWFSPSDSFVLEKIELDPRHRSQGFGTVMIEALREQARAQNCLHFIFAGVMRENSGAIRLYESMGAVAGPFEHGSCALVLTPP